MDKKHSKGLRRGSVGAVVVIFIFQTAAIGLQHYSYGAAVGQSFGPENAKDVWVNAEIFVPDNGIVRDIDIVLDLKHTSFCDLMIFIDSPQGDTACIGYYDEYSFVAGKKSLGWIILDEESRYDIDRAKNLFIGPYRPNGPDRLSMFYGQQSSGIWSVRICDTIYYDTGTLNSARIDMVINPEPASIFLITAGACFLFGTKRR